MKNLRHKTRILCLLITILIINLGCAHHLTPLSEEVSANLGTIGVCTSIYNADLYISRKPVTDWGEGCDRGVKAFIGNPAAWGLAFIEFPPAILLLPIVLLIGTPIACIVGGLSTESESEVQEAEALLRNAISDLNIQAAFQYHFLRIAREKTPYIILPLEDIEFDDIKEKLNYTSLADKGVDTVVWIDISKIGLTTGRTSSINPSLRFSMSCSIELIRATDGEVVYRHIWEKKCDDDEFVDWADNYAEPFRKEYKRCCKSVAEQIVKDLFLTEPQKQVNEKPNYASISPEDSKPKPLTFNPNEPWTGTWKVTGGPWGGFVLKLKQSGNMVKSIRGSDHDIKAKVKGDRLKGWYGDTVQIHIDFKISKDCTLFKGKGSWYQGTFYLKGERQE